MKLFVFVGLLLSFALSLPAAPAIAGMNCPSPPLATLGASTGRSAKRAVACDEPSGGRPLLLQGARGAFGTPVRRTNVAEAFREPIGTQRRSQRYFFPSCPFVSFVDSKNNSERVIGILGITIE